MGNFMSLQAASDDKIQQLSKDANALNSFIKIGGLEVSANGAAMQAILSNLSSKDVRMNMLVDALGWKKKLEHNSGPSLDLDKSFQALHYLLSGSPDKGHEPACYLCYGGRVIGMFEQEYEVRAISSAQLAAFEVALQPIDREELMRRYNGKAMTAANIYPSQMWDRPDSDGREFLCSKFGDLKNFLAKAKSAREGMIICAR